MRKDLVRLGGAMTGVGIVVVVVASLFLAGAMRDFFACINGAFQGPGPFPTACADALARITVWQVISGIGYVIGGLGVVVLVVGLLIDTEPRPRPFYPPPGYIGSPAPPPARPPAPPPGAPPEGPGAP